MSEDTPDKIEIIKQEHNILKNKLGGLRLQTNETGELAPELIEKANKIIASMCEGCEDKISDQLSIISSVWKEMQNTENVDERNNCAEKIFTASHEIKDIGSHCGYTLSAHFAESLRDYIAETALNIKNQKIIVEAHINAMMVVHKQGIKEDAGPAAEELKKMVKVAIEKYG